MTFLVDHEFEHLDIPKDLINPASFNLTVRTVRRAKKEWEEITSLEQSWQYWKSLGYPDVLDDRNRDLFFGQEMEIDRTDPVVLLPGQGALFSTNEKVRILNGQMGFLMIRSGPARGRYIQPATLFDPGFGDPVPMVAVLEIGNTGPWPIIIRRNQSVCQLVVFQGKKSSTPYQGKFANQTGAEPPKGVK